MIHGAGNTMGETAQNSKIKYVLSWVAWPFLFSVCMGATAYGFSVGHPQLAFNLSYLFLIISLLFLEHYMPHEQSWKPSDGQFWVDIGHTLTSKGTAQIFVVVNGTMGAADSLDAHGLTGLGLWPSSLPMVVQVALALMIAEFGLYWAHRSAHLVPKLWRFHAIHHSVRKLWFVNTGRFHIVDSLYKIALGIMPLLILGAPMVMLKWVACVTAFVGLLTHCNVEMRCGVLSWIFNTPILHRWHHSKDLREGNKNFSENLMLWDIVFGTYFNEKRRPPAEIGIHEYMPRSFRHQLIWPFLSKAKRKEVRNRLGAGV